MRRVLVSREVGLTALAAAAGLGLVLAMGLLDWPGQPFDCAANPCYCELTRPGLVKQLGNTWSNLGAVLAGLLLAAHAARLRTSPARVLRPHPGLDTLGLLLPPVLVFQGVGSMLFHAGLTTWGSALDAMSMFATTGLLVATNLHRLGVLTPPRIGPLWAALMGAGLLAGFLVPAAVANLVFLLFLTILGTEVLLTRRGRTPSAALFRAGLGLHLVGVTVWFLSASEGLPLCEPSTPWQGHALWHLTAAGAVSLFALHAFRNLSRLAQGPPLSAVNPEGAGWLSSARRHTTMGFLSSLFGGNAATAQQARAWVEGGATLLDVRTPGEFGGGHLPGARNVPLQVLASSLKQVGKKGDKVVVYCQSGGRSAQARAVLEAQGFLVTDLGPMSAWK